MFAGAVHTLWSVVPLPAVRSRQQISGKLPTFLMKNSIRLKIRRSQYAGTFEIVRRDLHKIAKLLS